MGGILPLPTASWLLDSALHHAEQARTALQQVPTDDWQGTAAAAHRARLLGLHSAVTAFSRALTEAQRQVRHHEREVQALQAQYGDAR